MSTTSNQVTQTNAVRIADQQMEMFRRSESLSLFIRVIQRVSCFQKGTINNAFSKSSSRSTSGSTSCDTTTWTGNEVNNLRG